jgi:hypothetical protein
MPAQVYAQPVFATIEDVLLKAVPSLDKRVHKDWIVRLVYRWAAHTIAALLDNTPHNAETCVSATGTVPTMSCLPLSVCRSMYVVVTTFVACALPFFGAFVGLVGEC